ncbi:MAG: 30S ribosomal protein S13 [Nitrospirae bacterium]|nr:30S ribosomal protein S13 [Nitrospirota bacterium]
MARIAGVELPDGKRVEVALTYIYGIGRPLSKKILEEARIDAAKRMKQLSDDEITRIRQLIEAGQRVEGDLRREETANIKRLIDLRCWRGLRHMRNLPVRGQRTRTNARTRRGARKTVAGRGKPRGAKKG